MDNVFPEWHVLNRLKVPQPVTKEAKNFEEFDIKEAKQITLTLDNLIGSAIERYNHNLNTKLLKIKMMLMKLSRINGNNNINNNKIRSHKSIGHRKQ